VLGKKRSILKYLYRGGIEDQKLGTCGGHPFPRLKEKVSELLSLIIF